MAPTSSINELENNYDVYKFEDSFRKYAHVKSTCVRKAATVSPLFSVFIPTYKRLDTLKETLASVLSQQDYKEPFEIIIVNNDPDGINETFKLVNSLL